MKSVLVTGGDGFIGSQLTEMLVASGYQVKALSQYNSLNNWGWLEEIQSKENLPSSGGMKNKQNHLFSIVFLRKKLIKIIFGSISAVLKLKQKIKFLMMK